MAATMYVTICKVITGRVVGAEGPSTFGAVITAVEPRLEHRQRVWVALDDARVQPRFDQALCSGSQITQIE